MPKKLKARCLRVLAASSMVVAGCAGLLPAPVPMKALHYPYRPSGPARCLVVFLPGVGDEASAFADHGFVQALQTRGLSVDVEAAEATLGYYTHNTVLTRLETDVMGEAHRSGYEQVWLVGISLGGLGATLYAKAHPEIVSGLYLLAPYLGDEAILKEIAAAGGVASWEPGALRAGDDQRELWRWLKAVTGKRPTAPPLYLGFGESDRLRAAHHLLAAVLPAEQVLRVEGGHDWPPWEELWTDFLSRGELARRCSAEGPQRSQAAARQ